MCKRGKGRLHRKREQRKETARGKRRKDGKEKEVVKKKGKENMKRER